MKIWIYTDGCQQGPFTLEELLDKPVTPETKVWFAGLPKWYPAGTLEELRPLFDGSLEAETRTFAVQEQPDSPKDVATDDAVDTHKVHAGNQSGEATDMCDVVTHEVKADDSADSEACGCANEPSDEEPSQPAAPAAPPFVPSDYAAAPAPEMPQYYPAAPVTPIQQPVPPCPDTYMIWSVLLLVLCCSPFALAALIGSIMVMNRYNKGNVDGAKKASEFTAWMIMISIALGALPSIVMAAFL